MVWVGKESGRSGAIVQQPCSPDFQVGVTAMLIASKYEEIWAPELNDFVYISDRAYKKEQILTMEKVMLNALKFNLTGVNLMTLCIPRTNAALP